MKFLYSGIVVNGKIESPEFYNDLLLYKDGSNITISIEEKKTKRSRLQHNLWWRYMKQLADRLGYTKDEIHEICKYKFLKREKVCEETGEILEYINSTTKLDKEEFSVLITQLQEWSVKQFNLILN